MAMNPNAPAPSMPMPIGPARQMPFPNQKSVPHKGPGMPVNPRMPMPC
jgi:hypothetical protein